MKFTTIIDAILPLFFLILYAVAQALYCCSLLAVSCILRIVAKTHTVAIARLVQTMYEELRALVLTLVILAHLNAVCARAGE